MYRPYSNMIPSQRPLTDWRKTCSLHTAVHILQECMMSYWNDTSETHNHRSLEWHHWITDHALSRRSLATGTWMASAESHMRMYCTDRSQKHPMKAKQSCLGKWAPETKFTSHSHNTSRVKSNEMIMTGYTLYLHALEIRLSVSEYYSTLKGCCLAID